MTVPRCIRRGVTFQGSCVIRPNSAHPRALSTPGMAGQSLFALPANLLMKTLYLLSTTNRHLPAIINSVNLYKEGLSSKDTQEPDEPQRL